MTDWEKIWKRHQQYLKLTLPKGISLIEKDWDELDDKQKSEFRVLMSIRGV